MQAKCGLEVLCDHREYSVCDQISSMRYLVSCNHMSEANIRIAKIVLNVS